MKAAAPMKAMKTVGAEAKGTVLAKKAMKAAMKAMKIVGTEAKGTVLAKKAMKAAAPMKAMKTVGAEAKGTALRCVGRLRCVDVSTLVERRPGRDAPRGAGAQTLVRWVSVRPCTSVQNVCV